MALAWIGMSKVQQINWKRELEAEKINQAQILGERLMRHEEYLKMEKEFQNSPEFEKNMQNWDEISKKFKQQKQEQLEQEYQQQQEQQYICLDESIHEQEIIPISSQNYVISQQNRDKISKFEIDEFFKPNIDKYSQINIKTEDINIERLLESIDQQKSQEEKQNINKRKDKLLLQLEQTNKDVKQVYKQLSINAAEKAIKQNFDNKTVQTYHNYERFHRKISNIIVKMSQIKNYEDNRCKHCWENQLILKVENLRRQAHNRIIKSKHKIQRYHEFINFVKKSKLSQGLEKNELVEKFIKMQMVGPSKKDDYLAVRQHVQKTRMCQGCNKKFLRSSTSGMSLNDAKIQQVYCCKECFIDQQKLNEDLNLY